MNAIDFINHFKLLPESVMETCDVLLTFESVDEILWYVHSNEIPLAVLSQGTVCFGRFERKVKFSIFLNFYLATTRSERVK